MAYCVGPPGEEERYEAAKKRKKPIPDRRQVILLPKLHLERCILPLSELKVHKSVARKHAARFDITVDACFADVVDKCIEQHGENWLYPPLVASLKKMHAANDKGREVNRVSVHSFEAWERPCDNKVNKVDKKANGGTAEEAEAEEEAEAGAEAEASAGGSGSGAGGGGVLVAGEIGYSVGNVYTAMTGFSTVPNSGTVQCVATASLLKTLGFAFWDLGELLLLVLFWLRSVDVVLMDLSACS